MIIYLSFKFTSIKQWFKKILPPILLPGICTRPNTTSTSTPTYSSTGASSSRASSTTSSGTLFFPFHSIPLFPQLQQEFPNEKCWIGNRGARPYFNLPFDHCPSVLYLHHQSDPSCADMESSHSKWFATTFFNGSLILVNDSLNQLYYSSSQYIAAKGREEDYPWHPWNDNFLD